MKSVCLLKLTALYTNSPNKSNMSSPLFAGYVKSLFKILFNSNKYLPCLQKNRLASYQAFCFWHAKYMFVRNCILNSWPIPLGEDFVSHVSCILFYSYVAVCFTHSSHNLPVPLCYFSMPTSPSFWCDSTLASCCVCSFHNWNGLPVTIPFRHSFAAW